MWGGGQWWLGGGLLTVVATGNFVGCKPFLRKLEGRVFIERGGILMVDNEISHAIQKGSCYHLHEWFEIWSRRCSEIAA
jgi:hypothetical protein